MSVTLELTRVALPPVAPRLLNSQKQQFLLACGVSSANILNLQPVRLLFVIIGWKKCLHYLTGLLREHSAISSSTEQQQVFFKFPRVSLL